MSTIYPQPGGQVPTFSTYASLPAVASDGALAITTDTGLAYSYSATSAAWTLAAQTTTNAILNGDFDIWQRGTTVTQTSVTSVSAYLADRWFYNYVSASALTFTASQSASVPTPAQSKWDSQFSSQFACGSTVTFSTSDTLFPYVYRMEGSDFQPFFAQPCCLSFWFMSSVTGTYSVSFTNSATNRSYVTTFSVSNASTWQQVVLPFTMDTTGTWLTTTGIGLQIRIAAVTGSTFQTSTLNAWQAGDFRSANTTTNYANTAAATLNIAQVAFRRGTSYGPYTRATGSFAAEIAACQRYFEQSYDITTVAGTNTTAGAWTGTSTAVATSNGNPWPLGQQPRFRVLKRATPTVSLWTSAGTSGSWTIGTVDRASSVTASTTAFVLNNNTGGSITPAADVSSGQWTADSEL